MSTTITLIGDPRSPAPDGTLPMWTLYEKPADYPTQWVLRRWLIVGGPEPVATHDAITCDTPEPLRNFARSQGLIKIDRSPQDQKQIVECWF